MVQLDFQPLVAGDLVIADDAADAFAEDFSSAARQRPKAGFLQANQDLARTDLAALRKITDLHHGEGLQMHARVALFQAAQHLAVPIEGELGMEAADDVELGNGFGVTVARLLPNLFERHGVRVGIANAFAEGAELATGDADVGGVDVAVDVEEGLLAVEALADEVRHPAYRQDVGRAVERQAVLSVQALAGFDLFTNRIEVGILKYRCH
jgi:hypothetical protein